MLIVAALDGVQQNNCAAETLLLRPMRARSPSQRSRTTRRAEFLQGRALSEKLQGHDSLQHFDKAIALDPEFATAELARANVLPPPKSSSNI